MRLVTKDDPRFWAGIMAVQSIGLVPHVPTLGERYSPGEVIRAMHNYHSVEVMLLAREHLVYRHPRFEWVPVDDLAGRLFYSESPYHAIATDLRLLLKMVAVGKLEVYALTTWPAPSRTVRVTDYVFAVFDWEYVLAFDAFRRLGGIDGRRQDSVD